MQLICQKSYHRLEQSRLWLMAYCPGQSAVGTIVNFESELEKAKAEFAKNFKDNNYLIKAVGNGKFAKQLKDVFGNSLEKHVALSEAFEIVFDPTLSSIRLAKSEKSNVATTGSSSIAAVAKKEKVKILIVDDSKTIRQLLTKIFSRDADLEVVAEAELPSQVEGLIEKFRPDVITLDIHMPEMDGITLLKNYLPKYKIPTVMISSISLEEGPLVLSALESGAVDYIQKPRLDEIGNVAPLIIEKVKGAAQQAKIGGFAKVGIAPMQSIAAGNFPGTDLIVIGSSTGGTEALRVVLTALPAQIPPIVIVQHIPPVFSKAFSNRLNDLCKFKVTEAVDNDLIEANHVYVAPGGLQLALKQKGPELRVSLSDAPPVNRHKPSVDVLFDSVPMGYVDKTIAVILTGMGNDGGAGMKRLRDRGVYTIGQDEASCTVYGMPRVAYELGGVQTVLSLDKISLHLSQGRKKRAA